MCVFLVCESLLSSDTHLTCIRVGLLSAVATHRVGYISIIGVVTCSTRKAKHMNASFVVHTWLLICWASQRFRSREIEIQFGKFGVAI